MAAEAVVRKFFLSKGWSISSERTKFDGVEVDIIVEKDKRRVLLEVKHLDNTWRAFERIGTKQIQRLKYVLLGLRKIERTLKIEGYVVFVLNNEKLHFISLDEII
jgi:Holliday junction resolvase-like predicted endonuclease